MGILDSLQEGHQDRAQQDHDPCQSWEVGTKRGRLAQSAAVVCFKNVAAGPVRKEEGDLEPPQQS